MVSIADVAKKSHVSKMTVSRVLNHPEQVSPEISDVVQRAINELGYVQQRAGRALATSRTYTVAFVMLDEVSNVDPYFGQLITYVSDYLYQEGYNLELHRSLNDHFYDIDGILVSGARAKDQAKLNALPFPLVAYGNQPEIASVDVDNKLGTMLAKEHLIASGYQHLIYLGIDLDEQFALERLNGFKAIDTSEHVTETIYQLPNSDKEARDFFNSLTVPPLTGVVTASDRLALGTLYSCYDKGLIVPNDVGIVGFDGIFINHLSPLNLTTIAQPLQQIAQTMVQTLLTAINSNHQTLNPSVIPPTLLQGETTTQLAD
ncbi:LacI family DNA-binding transcriptional regulator [Weissella viridescens]|nr:LacI family DNA-binding transcriptional regulator [Weissella viridescens]